VVRALLRLDAVSARAQLKLAFHSGVVATAIALTVVAVATAQAGAASAALLALSGVKDVQLVVALVAGASVLAATEHEDAVRTDSHGADLAALSGDVLGLALNLRGGPSIGLRVENEVVGVALLRRVRAATPDVDLVAHDRSDVVLFCKKRKARKTRTIAAQREIQG
jgi:hypothetical protein